MTFDPPEDEDPRSLEAQPVGRAGIEQRAEQYLLIIGALLLLVAGVVVFAGRPIAFYIVHRKTVRQVPRNSLDRRSQRS